VLDGTLSCAQAIQDTITGTRRLVRKQDTWFRRDQRITWLDAGSGTLLEDALEAVGTPPETAGPDRS
jgi:tRNA dimethylallyltransferase